MDNLIKILSGIDLIYWGEEKECTQILRRRIFNDYYGLQYTHRGNLLFQMDERPVRCYSAPCLFISAPGHIYTYGTPPGESRHHVYLCFNGPALAEWAKAGLLTLPDSEPVMPIRWPDRFLAALYKLQTLRRHPLESYPGRTGLLLLDLLLLVHQPTPHFSLASDLEQPLHDLYSRLLLQPDREYDFQQEAKKMSLSYSHFRRLFRELTHLPPGQFLLSCRIDRAKTLLLTTRLGIGEISAQCGFEDEFYFSRLFRKRMNCSPSAYRKNGAAKTSAPPSAER